MQRKEAALFSHLNRRLRCITPAQTLFRSSGNATLGEQYQLTGQGKKSVF